MSKTVIVVAGPNGSGKTTFAREYLRDSEVSEYISADAIAERTVTTVFIFLKSAETCVARVRNRVSAGGHHVPTEDVVRRFYRSKHNFWHIYRHLVDRWSLFYNSVEHFQEVASGEGRSVTVTNETFFELFMRDSHNGGA